MTTASEAILVTGGAGFIGANFILNWMQTAASPVINLDLLTYAGNRANLASITGDARHTLVEGDICNADLVASLLAEHRPWAIVHCAAESHVDHSIAAPAAFLRTNVQGSFTLLEQARLYYSTLDAASQSRFRFLQVSTDEVYGSLAPGAPPCTEASPYAPNSPYAASKAASDHMARAYHRTYGLPVLTTHCSNNYGPLQFPEKLIPLVITNALAGKPLPVYGDGQNLRDWIFVADHCSALRAVLERGRVGETYNIGANCEVRNLDLVNALCDLLDELRPDPALTPRRQLIRFVVDRPGHDRRYALDATKIRRELGWQPLTPFALGLRQTVAWYIEHGAWLQALRGSRSAA